MTNEREAAVALTEISGLARQRSDQRQLAALDDLATRLQQCADTPGSYLWLQGD
ncbi:hypothetical protein AB0M68_11630 [Streptomyces sp. NPDC051453]|uniref:hypothetical protein n=1 Tax=Streptomyces sp. NPDC051453 TaxID=3154941 RepID=UPI003444CFFD